jgi:hypothetical protein
VIRQQPDTGSRKTLSPFVRIAGSVEHAVDGHRSFRVFVEDCIRKAANQPPAIIVVDDRVHVRRAADCFNAGINASQDLFTQAGAAALLPGVGG